MYRLQALKVSMFDRSYIKTKHKVILYGDEIVFDILYIFLQSHTRHASWLLLQRTRPRFAVRTEWPMILVADQFRAQRTAGLRLLCGQLFVQSFGQVHGLVSGHGVMDANRNGPRHFGVMARAIGHLGQNEHGRIGGDRVRSGIAYAMMLDGDAVGKSVALLVDASGRYVLVAALLDQADVQRIIVTSIILY